MVASDIPPKKVYDFDLRTSSHGIATLSLRVWFAMA